MKGNIHKMVLKSSFRIPFEFGHFIAYYLEQDKKSH